MTIVSQIITDAYRQSNLLAIGTEPTDPQKVEALRYLNRIVKSVFGNEAGENLRPLPLGGNNIDAPSGFPWYGNNPDPQWWVPLNRRLFLNLTEAAAAPLHPIPEDGARFGVSDTSKNLDTNNLTVMGNGRTIEDQFSIVLDTPGLNREWFYRGDLGNWMRTTDLVADDPFPFPEEFDQMFITMLAMTANPAYAASVDQQIMVMYNRARNQFRARYNNVIETPTEDALLRMPRTVSGRDQWVGSFSWIDPTSAFNRGYPW